MTTRQSQLRQNNNLKPPHLNQHLHIIAITIPQDIQKKIAFQSKVSSHPQPVGYILTNRFRQVGAGTCFFKAAKRRRRLV